MQKIKLGIFGLGRGRSFFPAILHEGVEVVAVCETIDRRIEMAKKEYKDAGGANEFAVYKNFDEFINHDLDAVLLCNFFNEHTKYAIKCLEKDIHVLCECQSNATMADGVKLVRAQEKSNAKFMLLENYPFMLFNLEMKKVVDGGTLGKIVYAEGEYNHPGKGFNENSILGGYCSGDKHWRKYLPKTYYLTHSLAPLMYITGTRPKRVTALPIFEPRDFVHSYVGEIASVMTTINENDSVFRFFGHSSFGYEENSYRFCGLNGQVENVRGDESKIMLAYNEWNKPENKEKVNFYKAEWSEEDKPIASIMGHAGGDYFVIKKFANVIRGLEENPFDVYFSTTLASVAILAHRSQMENGKPYDIPNFRLEEDRAKWENDNLTPFWNGDNPPTYPCTTRESYTPSEKATKWFNETWNKFYGNKKA